MADDVSYTEDRSDTNLRENNKNSLKRQAGAYWSRRGKKPPVYFTIQATYFCVSCLQTCIHYSWTSSTSKTAAAAALII